MKILESKNLVLIIQNETGLLYSNLFLKQNDFKIIDDFKELKKDDQRKIIFFVRNPYAYLVHIYSKKYPRYAKNVQKFHDFVSSFEDENFQTKNLSTIETQIGRKVDELYYSERIKNLAHLSTALGLQVEKNCFLLRKNSLHYNQYFRSKDNSFTSKIESILEKDLTFFGYSMDSTINENYFYCKNSMINNAYLHFKQKSLKITSNLCKSIENIKQKKIITEDERDDYYRLTNTLDSVLKNSDEIGEKNILRKKIFDFYEGQSTTIIKNTKTIKLDKVYFISLNRDSDDCNKKILHLKSLFGNRLEVFDAVDSRGENKFVYKDFNLDLNPLSKEYEMNFSTSFGAVGCYLSHYSIYRKILSEKYNHVLILEDDIDMQNLDKISNQMLIPDNAEFVQLNSRAIDTKNYSYFFCENTVDGTESYLISYSGAKKMLDATYSIKDTNLKYYSSFLAWLAHDKISNTYNTELMYRPYMSSIDSINCIRAPIDKFLHLISSSFVDSDLRLSSFVLPLLKLDKTSKQSSVLSDIPHWEYQTEEISQFENICKTYKWWELN